MPSRSTVILKAFFWLSPISINQSTAVAKISTESVPTAHALQQTSRLEPLIWVEFGVAQPYHSSPPLGLGEVTIGCYAAIMYVVNLPATEILNEE